MSDKKNVVRVKIAGEELTLRSDRSEEYTREVADFVNQRIEEIRSSGSILETHKAAILTALALADELFEARRDDEEIAERMRSLTSDLVRLLPPKKRASRITGPFASPSDTA